MIQQTNNFYTQYGSLGSSRVGTQPATHQRRLSTTNRIQQLNRNSSQKKISITCQNGTGLRIPLKKQGGMQGELKLRYQNHNKRGQTENVNPVLNSVDNQNRSIDATNGSLQSLSSFLVSKMQGMRQQYQGMMRVQGAQLEDLRNRLAINQQQLMAKQQQIVQLQRRINHNKSQNNYLNEGLTKNISLRINDFQVKIRLLTDYYLQNQRQALAKVDHLTNKILNKFGNKINNLKTKCISFVQYSTKKLSSLQTMLDLYRKNTQQTKKSQQTVTTSAQVVISQQDISFFDDCFFYPTQRSQNCQLLMEMAERRRQAVQCWIDSKGCLRYCDSGSYVFNRKGDMVSLGRQEINWLVQQQIIVVF